VAHRFVAAPDVVDDREGDNGSDAVGEKKETQAVGLEQELADTGLLLDELE